MNAPISFKDQLINELEQLLTDLNFICEFHWRHNDKPPKLLLARIARVSSLLDQLKADPGAIIP